MRIAKLTIICLLVLWGAAGCKKTAGTYNYTIVNQFSQPVNVAIYRTAADYSLDINDVYEGAITANGKLTLPSALFADNNTFVIDWSTADYTYTNWGSQISFVPSAANNTYTISNAIPASTLRKFCLNGGSITTSWQAVNAYQTDSNGNLYSIWAQLQATANDTFRQLVLNKDFSCAILDKDPQFHITTNTYAYQVKNGQNQLIINFFEGTDTINMTGNLGTNAYNDTIWANLHDGRFAFTQILDTTLTAGQRLTK